MRAIGVLVFALAVAWSGVAPLNADLATVGGQAPTCNINGHCTGTGGGQLQGWTRQHLRCNMGPVYCGREGEHLQEHGYGLRV